MHNHLQATFKQTKTIIKGLLNYRLAHFLELLNCYHTYIHTQNLIVAINAVTDFSAFEDNKVTATLKKKIRFL